MRARDRQRALSRRPDRSASRARTQPEIIISDERALLLDQGGGIRKVLPLLRGKPFFLCNTDAFWIEGPLSNIRTARRRMGPARMDALLLVAATSTSVGVDWPGDFTWMRKARLRRTRRARRRAVRLFGRRHHQAGTVRKRDARRVPARAVLLRRRGEGPPARAAARRRVAACRRARRRSREAEAAIARSTILRRTECPRSARPDDPSRRAVSGDLRAEPARGRYRRRHLAPHGAARSRRRDDLRADAPRGARAVERLDPPPARPRRAVAARSCRSAILRASRPALLFEAGGDGPVEGRAGCDERHRAAHDPDAARARVGRAARPRDHACRWRRDQDGCERSAAGRARPCAGVASRGRSRGADRRDDRRGRRLVAIARSRA